MADRPAWLKVRAPSRAQARGMRGMRRTLAEHELTTVCQGARCPNAAECWGAGTATFMLLGEICTRACRFCAVPTGDPSGRIDPTEPERIAAAVAGLGLRYAVLTSVDRDDLIDGGAGIFAESVRAIRQRAPGTAIEVLIPDFRGRRESLERVAAAAPEVVGHNLETVRRLSPALRDHRAGYDQSLAVLSRLRRLAPGLTLKSSLMLGLGESRQELLEAFSDLRTAGVDILTLGQYLRPTAAAAPVVTYVSPESFEELASEARGLGFRAVVAGPYVRSSYHAASCYQRCSG